MIFGIFTLLTIIGLIGFLVGFSPDPGFFLGMAIAILFGAIYLFRKS